MINKTIIIEESLNSILSTAVQKLKSDFPEICIETGGEQNLIRIEKEGDIMSAYTREIIAFGDNENFKNGISSMTECAISSADSILISEICGNFTTHEKAKNLYKNCYPCSSSISYEKYTEYNTNKAKEKLKKLIYFFRKRTNISKEEIFKKIKNAFKFE